MKWLTVNNKRVEKGFDINFDCDFCDKQTTVLAIVPRTKEKLFICKGCLTNAINAIDETFQEGFKK